MGKDKSFNFSAIVDGVITVLLAGALISWLGAFIDVQNLKAADVERKISIDAINIQLKDVPIIKNDVKWIKGRLGYESPKR